MDTSPPPRNLGGGAFGHRPLLDFQNLKRKSTVITAIEKETKGKKEKEVLYRYGVMTV